MLRSSTSMMSAAMRKSAYRLPNRGLSYSVIGGPSTVRTAKNILLNRNAAGGIDRILQRFKIGGERLKLSRMIMLALAAMALEKQRQQALQANCEALKQERSLLDYEKNEMSYLQRLGRSLRALRRIGVLTCLFIPAGVLMPVAYATQNVAPRISDVTWEYILYGIEVAGPTFIKLSQWASTRSDLFPAEFCLRFARLQDATRGHTWSATETTLIEQLGPDWDQKLEIDNKDPIGSGCIAQVYQGKMKAATGMKKAGEEVAIKIVHPHIREKVELDFYILNKLTRFLESLPRFNFEYLAMSDSVEQFRQIMVPQLDLRCEAKNLEKFRIHFAENNRVEFPEPFDHLTSSNILVEGFCRGSRIMSYANPGAKQQDREDLAHLGVKTVMEMLFMYDFVHGDLHPGNIMVFRNKEDELSMNLLDCGICVEMGESDHKNLINILGAFIKRDGLLAGKLMVDTAKHKNATDDDVRLFCEGIQKICSDDLDNNFLEKVGDYLADICDLACRHKVKLESKFINASLAVEIIEGLACKLHPEMEVQKVALPLVLKAEVMHGIRKAKDISWGEWFTNLTGGAKQD
mmetsp:Transcript_25375/g.47685  ORF Transcript_25375/g.47685 Transcript_25375/m.47685 type:complete len:576 (+) Transcript_25375:71-1798(+)